MLDPAQNHTFRDHYLEVELDLSDVLFIATANVADTIPDALLDRMEVMRLDGYTEDEKVAIAAPPAATAARRGRRSTRRGRGHRRRATAIVGDHTREAGVRQLERQIGKALRKVATARRPTGRRPGGRHRATSPVGYLGRPRFTPESADAPRPGVATGLAVTGAGGDMLFVEATSMAGEPGLRSPASSAT